MEVSNLAKRASADFRGHPREIKAEPCVAGLRGEALLKRVFKYLPRKERLKINGLNLEVKAYHVNISAYRELGISPHYLRGGAQVHVVSRADYERYCGTIGTKTEDLAGVYAPKGSREIKMVMAAGIKTLPFEARKILVPDDVDALTLCHEILHDLFCSWNLEDPHAERIGFSRLVIQQIRMTFLRAPESPEADFFRGVAARCDASLVFPIPEGEIFTERTQKFIGEVFAYGASMAIFSRMSAERSETGLGKVPEELMIYFNRVIVHPRLLQKAPR